MYSGNPNTKYGRRKNRRIYQERRAQMTSEEKTENDVLSCIGAIVILAVVLLLVFLVSGSEGLINYLKR